MVIRKISIGSDLKESSMNYIVGSRIINDNFKVYDILQKEKYIEIYIINSDDEVVKWKEVSVTTPHVLEYNINI